MGFTWRARTLVPPRENLGGSYPMLNSIDVRKFVSSARLGIICVLGGTAFLQPSDRRVIIPLGLGAPKSAALVPL